MSGEENQSGKRDPKAEDWATINSLGSTQQSQMPTFEKRATQDSFVVPTEVQSIDFEPEEYTSRRGLLVVLGILAVGAVLFLIMSGSEDAGPVAQDTAASKEATTKAPPEPIPAFRDVEFKSDPEQAIVILNGNVLEGSTPIDMKLSTAGRSQVRFVSAGFRAETAELMAEDNQVWRKLFPLKDSEAKIIVQSKPSKAEVHVDGTFMGVTPLKGEDGKGEKVAAGDWSVIQVAKEGFADQVYIRRISKNSTHRFVVELDRQTAELSDSQVRVTSTPSNAQLFARIDNDTAATRIGSTGSSGLKFKRPVGKRLDLEVQSECYAPQSMVLDLKKPSYELSFVMEPLKKCKGSVHIEGPKGVVGFLESAQHPIKSFPKTIDGLIASKRYTLRLHDEKTKKKRLKVPIEIKPDEVTHYVVSWKEGELTVQPKD